MIKSITISNFKSFNESHEVFLGDLTLLSGVNSSGKSSIYQVLLLLNQSFESQENVLGNELPTLNINNECLQIGKNVELLNDAKNSKITFKINWSDLHFLELDFTLNTALNIKLKNNNSEKFVLCRVLSVNHESKAESEYELTLSENLKWTLRAKNSVNFDSRAYALILDQFLKRDDKSPLDALYNQEVIFENVSNILFYGYDLYRFSIPIEDVVRCISPNKQFLYNYEEFKNYYKKENDSDFTETSIKLLNGNRFSRLNNFLKTDIMFIPPFRGEPQRVYSEGHRPNPLLSLLNSAEDEKVSYKYDYLTNAPIESDLKKALNYWVVDFFKFAEGVEVEELVQDFASEIFLIYNKKKIPINNMGFGLSQILPVIFKIICARKGSLIIVDEPEIHLHPTLQTKLADFFVEMSLVGKKIIIESHSEYLINRLIFLSIKHKAVSKNLKMLWVENLNNGARTREIEFDDMGFLIKSPTGFLTEQENAVEEINSFRMQLIEKKDNE